MSRPPGRLRLTGLRPSEPAGPEQHPHSLDQPVAHLGDGRHAADHHGADPDIADLTRPDRVRALNRTVKQLRSSAPESAG